MKGEVVDPMVRVMVSGAEADKASFETSVVKDNSFDPEWDEVFVFEVTNRDVALLSFEVYDQATIGWECIAASAFPISGIREGVRWVPLWDARLKSLDHCGLLVEVQINSGGRGWSTGSAVEGFERGAVAVARSAVGGLERGAEVAASVIQRQYNEGKQVLCMTKQSLWSNSEQAAVRMTDLGRSTVEGAAAALSGSMNVVGVTSPVASTVDALDQGTRRMREKLGGVVDVVAGIGGVMDTFAGRDGREITMSGCSSAPDKAPESPGCVGEGDFTADSSPHSGWKTEATIPLRPGLPRTKTTL
eukprot:gnl/TRDRNA2_/TRDRNA2_154008_c4_seq1.p1 gnl/TRDRNA2_/TRDRNA2_154008_c4~~gnl/TRDRNA2_/TRDRNA2_154008_c4_seq1.p1  ORF type:complete len:303 (-),score=54.39 gnl/TRDRNA2_/TRDRNA2_154008_c4_seq1:202-1110(-)